MRLAAIFALIFALGGLFPSAARAGDDGLYPKAPPAGSAFVRFLNGSGNGAAKISVAGKSYGSATLGTATPYVPVAHGAAKIEFGSASASPELKEGGHYAAILVKGTLSVLEEPGADNPLKAQIVLINVSSAKTVSLKTADGSVNIVDSVPSGKLGVRAVNAVNAPFSIYSDAARIEELTARPLERGQRYAVVVYDGADGKPAVSFN